MPDSIRDRMLLWLARRLNLDLSELYQVWDLRQAVARGGSALKLGADEPFSHAVVNKIDPLSLPRGLRLSPKPNRGYGVLPEGWESSGDLNAVPVSDWTWWYADGSAAGGAITPVDADGGNMAAPTVTGHPSSKLRWQVGNYYFAFFNGGATVQYATLETTAGVDIIALPAPIAVAGLVVPTVIATGYSGGRGRTAAALRIATGADIRGTYGFQARAVRVLT